MENKIGVVISSCDKYSYLWDIQIQFFERYWDNCPYDINLISDKKSYPYSTNKLKLKSYITNKESRGAIDWSNNLLSFLESSNYDYIIYFQEDYIPYKNVDQKRLDSLLNYVIKNKINYVRFYTAPMGNGESIKIENSISLKEIIPGSDWRHSLMVSIWNVNTLKSILSKCKDTNPWDFERLNICSDYDKFYCIDIPEYDSSDIIYFYGMYGSSGGFTFYPFIIDLIEKENIKKLNGETIDYNIRL